MIHGMAAKIRAATESETFDLGGMSTDTIASMIVDAFATPFESLPTEDGTEMIRLTFVVGAGKQARSHYDAGAMKAVTATLQQPPCLFSEDRGASCVLACQGMYKVQHDTGKNLKTVVVFPKVRASTQSSQSQQSYTQQQQESEQGQPLFPPNSIEMKVSQSTLSVFQNMVQSKCPTWSQKRALLQKVFQDTIVPTIDQYEQALMTGQSQLLAPNIQDFYDSCVAIEEKKTWLQVDQLQSYHIDQGRLTTKELKFLQEQNQEKINEWKSNNNNKKNGKKDIPKKLQERYEKLHSISSSTTEQFENQVVEPLKHHAALGKLWKQLVPLQHLDPHSNALLSVSDTQLLGKKVDLLQQIEQLEDASRGWLEEDDNFERRRNNCRKHFQQQFGIGKTGKGRTGASASSGSKGNKINSTGGKGAPSISATTKVRMPVQSNRWVTPGGGGGGQNSKSQIKKKRMQKGDVFGAMMANDDSSSSDDDDDSDDNKNNNPGTSISASTSSPRTSTTSSAQPTAFSSNNSTSTTTNTTMRASQAEERSNDTDVDADDQDDDNKNKNKNTDTKKKANKKKKKKSTTLSTDNNTAAASSSSSAKSGSLVNSSDESSQSSTAITMLWSLLTGVFAILSSILLWIVSILFGGKSKNNNNKKKKKN